MENIRSKISLNSVDSIFPNPMFISKHAAEMLERSSIFLTNILYPQYLWIHNSSDRADDITQHLPFTI